MADSIVNSITDGYIKVGGEKLPISSMSINYSVNAIPSCRVVLVIGKSRDGGVPIEKINNISSGTPIEVYMGFNGKDKRVFNGISNGITISTGATANGLRGFSHNIVLEIAHISSVLSSYQFGQRHFKPEGISREAFLVDKKTNSLSMESQVSSASLEDNRPAGHCKEVVERFVKWYQQGSTLTRPIDGIIKASTCRFSDDVIKHTNGMMMVGAVQSATFSMISSVYSSNADAFSMLVELARLCMLAVIPREDDICIAPAPGMIKFESGKTPFLTGRYITSVQTVNAARIPVSAVWVPKLAVTDNNSLAQPGGVYNTSIDTSVLLSSDYYRYPVTDKVTSMIIMDAPFILKHLLTIAAKSKRGEAERAAMDFRKRILPTASPIMHPEIIQNNADANAIGALAAKLLYADLAFVEKNAHISMDASCEFSSVLGPVIRSQKAWASDTMFGLLGSVIGFSMPILGNGTIEKRAMVGYVNGISLKVSATEKQFMYGLELGHVRSIEDDEHAILADEFPLYDNIFAGVE